MTRVIEPGTVVLPAASIYSMALDDEVWVRAFAPEPLLPRLIPGSEVVLTTDGSSKPYRGNIGYVSPAAEFTPKTVETPELRTQLVYRLRIRVEDHDAAIRQGMPVTIQSSQCLMTEPVVAIDAVRHVFPGSAVLRWTTFGHESSRA